MNTVRSVSMALALATVVVIVPAVSSAQSLSLSSTDDVAFHRTQRRRNIAGWSLIASGALMSAVTLTLAVRRYSDPTDDEFATGLALVTLGFGGGPVLVASGIGVLIKRRVKCNKHDHTDAASSISSDHVERGATISVGLTGASMSLSLSPQDDKDDAAFHRKQRRRNIAGWSLIAAGVVIPSITLPLLSRGGAFDNPPSSKFARQMSGFALAVGLSPLLIASGTGVLIKRRIRRNKHDQADAASSISSGHIERGATISIGLTGASMSLSF